MDNHMGVGKGAMASAFLASDEAGGSPPSIKGTYPPRYGG